MGLKFNKLTFLDYAEPKIRTNGIKRKMAFFKCDCGNIKKYDFSSVKNGHPKECMPCSRKTSAEKKIKHSLTKHPLYAKWQDMKKRCYNEKVDRYKNYGGCGIKVCNEWKNDFKTFYNWSLSNGWKQGLTIERKDNYKDYCPDNCKYITPQEQHYNKKNTFYVDIKGNKYSLSKLMAFNNMPKKYSVVWQGIKSGKSIEYYINKLNLNLYNIEID